MCLSVCLSVCHDMCFRTDPLQTVWEQVMTRCMGYLFFACTQHMLVHMVRLTVTGRVLSSFYTPSSQGYVLPGCVPLTPGLCSLGSRVCSLDSVGCVPLVPGMSSLCSRSVFPWILGCVPLTLGVFSLGFWTVFPWLPGCVPLAPGVCSLD
jgi:hypothetical protein